ncbi:MAG: carboxypeptidase-like regulatory domain-containing protein [Bacteroidota bacterium]
MILRAGLLFIAITLINPLHAQISVQGSVIDAESKRAIPYANIGILNTKTGTISNTDGTYKITVPDSLLLRKIIFSAIGYHRQEFGVNQLKQNPKVELEPRTIRLKNIVITADQNRQGKWLGNTRKNLLPRGKTKCDSASAGGAMALLIAKEDTSLNLIQKARIRIIRNTLPEFKIRFRILGLDKSDNNLPGKDLFKESLVVASSINQGWLEFDLSSKNFLVEQDSFYIQFEWLYEESDRHYIAQSYTNYMKNNPDHVIRDTVVVDGVPIPTVLVQHFYVGTFFAVTRSKRVLKKHVAYERSNSFAEWKRSASIVQAEVLMTD